MRTWSAWRTIVCDRRPLMSTTKPTPQASCSQRGSYSPWAGGGPRTAVLGFTSVIGLPPLFENSCTDLPAISLLLLPQNRDTKLQRAFLLKPVYLDDAPLMA